MRTNVASTSKILYVPAVRNASTLNLSTKLPNAARFPVTLVGRPPASQRRSRSRRKETNASPRRTVATQSAVTQVSHSPLPFLRQEVAKFAQLAPNVHRLLRLVGISNQEDGSQGFGTRLAASFGSEVLKTLDESSKTEQEILREWDLELDDPPREIITRAVASRFLQWTVEQKLPASLRERIQRLREIADLTSPADLYRGSRKTQRHVHLHVGPTNSGKTYNALLALANAQTGVYAGPLRLLAHEIFTRFNEGGIVDKDGKPITRTCNLVTGEVVKIVADNAPLTACTVEMLQSTASSTYDVAVIDEIQMIDDVNRGVAWTAAFMSLAAKEIHLCGELRAVELIRKLCEVTGDKLTVHSYERLTPLAVAQKGLGNKLVDLSTGDCLVAFSRARIFALQQRIQRETALKVAVIYGSLPPEVRSSQAQMFNQGEVDVLVGSDAIGMGLNLKIKRIIFESLYKYGETAGGRTMHKLPSSLIGQIAGRAGRYGMGKAKGVATTLEDAQLPDLQEALQTSPVPIQTAKLAPTEDQIRQMVNLLPSGSIGDALEIFRTVARTKNTVFQIPTFEDLENLARVTEGCVDLSFSELFVLAQAPVPYTKPILLDHFVSWLRVIKQEGSLNLKRWLENSAAGESMQEIQDYINACQADPTHRLRNTEFLRNNDPLVLCEYFHRLMMIYRWLSFRLEVQFPDGELAERLAQIGQSQLDWFLTRRISDQPGSRVKDDESDSNDSVTLDRRRQVRKVHRSV